MNSPATKNTSYLSTPALITFLEGQTSIPSPVLSAVYFICIIISTILIIIALRISHIVGSYHWNLKRLYWCSMFSWFALGTSKFLVIFAQHFHLNSKINFFDETGNIILHISGLIRYFFCYFFIVNLFSIILERSFATYFIRDYEQKQRNWIFYILFLFGVSVSVTFSILTVIRVITLLMLTIYVVVLSVLTSIGYGILEYWNYNRLQTLENDHRHSTYTLSIKYQLRENLNTLQSMKKLLMVALIATLTIAFLLMAPPMFGIPSSKMWVTHILIDILYHFNTFYLIPACLFYIPQNRNFLKRIFADKFGIGHAAPPNTANHFSNEGDVYFNMFQKSLRSSNNNIVESVKIRPESRMICSKKV